jgi:hypothetical protein
MNSFKLLVSQAQNINKYKKLRTKFAKCCANIYFNKQCLYSKVIPNFVQLKFPNTSSASRSATKKMQTMRLKDENKFLHKKKEQLNRELYRSHIQAANE